MKPQKRYHDGKAEKEDSKLTYTKGVKKCVT
jgi:hypothetical protein